ncbi:carboxylate-amine ligase [Kutzneria sp. CA-103260]|uniref:carboxylate-amine ligase n=1 Tax=Kutzneria sp. CA-103260 TaxID=2802641 RepID=UPI001BF11063|nr:glutamate--cysteine ligase [Kutzneria sp. CA-103260]QUQ66221.1 carboxylate-amine ligase [Kutzneria sp. CA-103260]
MHTIGEIGRQHHGKTGRLVVPIPRPGGARTPLTVGVEEEFLLVDYRTRRVAPRAPVVLAAAAGRLPGLQPEITQFQVETATPVCTTMAEVRENLVASREELAGTARRHGLRLAAVGTPVLGRAAPPPLTDNDRYRQMADEFGAVTDGLSICGCHVHVGIPGPEEGIRASNHLRPWLPVLLALSANSPFWEGRDTGYASWRYLVWASWPTAGPPPVFESPEQYERAVRSLLQVGAAMDRAMAYWDIRLSQQHPTIELRVCDVAATADEAVLIAALTRAMVATALQDTRPPLAMPQHLLKAASWRAARDGLGGSCVNPVTGHPLPTPVLVRQLIGRIRPALEDAGDLDLVLDLLESLVAKGCGADRQRRAFARNGKLTDVVDLLTAQTAGADELV